MLGILWQSHSSVSSLTLALKMIEYFFPKGFSESLPIAHIFYHFSLGATKFEELDCSGWILWDIFRVVDWGLQQNTLTVLLTTSWYEIFFIEFDNEVRKGQKTFNFIFETLLK